MSFSDAQLAVLEEMRAHLDGCPRCQRGPVAICEIGREIASRFHVPDPDEDIPIEQAMFYFGALKLVTTATQE